MSRAAEEHRQWIQQLDRQYGEEEDQRPWQEQANELLEIETKQEESD